MTPSEALRLGFRIIAEPRPEIGGYSVRVEPATAVAKALCSQPFEVKRFTPEQAMEAAIDVLARKGRAA